MPKTPLDALHFIICVILSHFRRLYSKPLLILLGQEEFQQMFSFLTPYYRHLRQEHAATLQALIEPQ